MHTSMWHLGRPAAGESTTEAVPSADMSVERDAPDDTSVVERGIHVAGPVPAAAAVLQRDAPVPEPIGAVPLPGMVPGEPLIEEYVLEEYVREELASDAQRLAEGELRG